VCVCWYSCVFVCERARARALAEGIPDMCKESPK
jgi:hypothetical protein